MIIKVDGKGIVEVTKEEIVGGKDTHAELYMYVGIRITPGFFTPKVNLGRITPEMQGLLDGMETIDLSMFVSEIEEEGFAYCERLRSISIPDKFYLRVLKDKTFMGCQSLQFVGLPFGLLAIGNQCFKDCTSLEEIVIPETVEVIGAGAFENCRNLKRITLPWRMKSLDNNVLSGDCCASEITYLRNEEYVLVDNLLLNKDGQTLVRYYSTDENEFTIPKTINRISDGAFRRLDRKLHKLIISNPLIEISKSAFTDFAWRLEDMEIEKVQIRDELILRNMIVYCKALPLFEVIDKNRTTVGLFYMPFLRGATEDINSPKEYDDWVIKESWYKNFKNRMIINRLKYPFELGQEAKENYSKYLKANKKEIIEWLVIEDEIESIIRFPELLITKNNIDEILGWKIIANKTELVAFLLDYKKNVLKIDPSKSKSLELKPLDPNSYKEIQKDWILADVTKSELTLAGYKGEYQNPLIFPSHAGKKSITRVGYHFTGGSPEIIIPEGYKTISYKAFSYRSWSLVKITLPESLVEIGDKAFLRCDVVFYAPKGSYAIEYARERNIKFVEL